MFQELQMLIGLEQTMIVMGFNPSSINYLITTSLV